jgi:hypothetical protein
VLREVEVSDYTVNVSVDVPHCPLCGEAMYAGGEIEIPGDPDFSEISHAVSMEIARKTEEGIIEHYQYRHRLRWWVASRLGLKRALGA